VEIRIKNINSRIVVERTDNGAIMYDVSEDGEVSSRMSYEMFFRDGAVNFVTISEFFFDVMDSLKIPMLEESSNKKISIVLTKIDPDKPSEGEEDDDQ